MTQAGTLPLKYMINTECGNSNSASNAYNNGTDKRINKLNRNG